MRTRRKPLQAALMSGALAFGMCVLSRPLAAQYPPQFPPGNGQWRIIIPTGNNGFFQVGNWRETGRYRGDMARQIHMAIASLPDYTVFDNLQFRIDRDGDEVLLTGQVK